MNDAKNITEEQAIAALATHLDISPDDISASTFGDRTEYDAGGLGDFLVVTNDEADTLVAEEIERSLWAFNAEFLAAETEIDVSAFKAIQANDRCEDNNDAMRSMIVGTCGLDEFVDSAVNADGRGHFLSGYDGEEIELEIVERVGSAGRLREVGRVYAYRTN